MKQIVLALALMASPAFATPDEYRLCVATLNDALRMQADIGGAITAQRNSLKLIRATSPTTPQIKAVDEAKSFNDVMQSAAESYTASIADLCETLR